MKKQRQIQKLIKGAPPDERGNLNGSHEDIVHRVAAAAYELYQQRGREDGHDVEDWLKAETIVKGQSVH